MWTKLHSTQAQLLPALSLPGNIEGTLTTPASCLDVFPREGILAGKGKDRHDSAENTQLLAGDGLQLGQDHEGGPLSNKAAAQVSRCPRLLA